MVQIHAMVKGIVPELQLISHLRGDWIPEKTKAEIQIRSHRNDCFAPPRLSWSLRKWGNDHRGMVYRLRKFSSLWAGSMNDLSRLDAAVMDDPVYFLPLFKRLCKLHIPVIAVCHNLETLSATRTDNKLTLDLLQEELEILSKCRLVITISREEDVLLNNLGISTLYIPYYPVEPILGRLLAVRENRKNSEKNGILMVGTMINLPTRDGMEQAAAWWQQNIPEGEVGKLIIGGYNSEIYFDPRLYGNSIDFRGTMDNTQMDSLLTRVKACISYQKNGPGALTRICEMLIAGVPVLANTHAARSYYNMKGVIEFRELDGLGQALTKIDQLDGEIPVPPAPDVSALSLEIHRIIG